MKSIFRKRKILAKANVLLAGPVRNVGNVIVHEVQALTHALSCFKEVQTLIVESDSSDNTLDVLAQLKPTISNFDYLSLGSLQKSLPKRTQRIARARNEIIEQVIHNPKYAHIDFIVMADMDGMNNLITPEKIAQCWDVKEDWDVITAVQREKYYDIWTLRHPDWCPDDCWAQKERLETLFGEAAAVNLAVSAKQIHMRPEFGLIEVDSAFGGLGIYTREAFTAGRYDGFDMQGNEASDHIHFHQMLRAQNFRIYINCALVNCTQYPEHTQITQKPKIKPIFRMIQKLGHLTFGRKRFDKYLKRLLSESSGEE